ncbi:MAG: outer membrane beta-barrel protein [Rhodanobacter sp.]
MRFGYLILGAASLAMASVSANARADDWSGIYVGVLGSANSTKTDFALPGDAHDQLLDRSVSKTHAVGGALLGYNYQFGNKVLGLEVDATSAAGTQSVTACALPDGCFTSAHDSFTTFNKVHTGATERYRVRFGFIAHETLFYGAVGYSHMIARMSLVGNCFNPATPSVPTVYNFNRSKSLSGLNLALGVERSISKNFFLRGEYLYEDFGSETWKGAAPEWNDRRISLRTNQLRLAIGMRF